MDEDQQIEQIQSEHEFLNMAKSYDWIGLSQQLERDPGLINAQPGMRWTALHQAAISGERSVVEWLLCARADVTRQTGDGRTPLEVCTHADIVDLLMAARDNRFNPEVQPAAPTAVGGYLPVDEGGNASEYFWPPQYSYEQTFKYRQAQAQDRHCKYVC
jgi:Ankyrin repeats (3 copies)